LTARRWNRRITLNFNKCRDRAGGGRQAYPKQKDI
jgi:hypothetical protein